LNGVPKGSWWIQNGRVEKKVIRGTDSRRPHVPMQSCKQFHQERSITSRRYKCSLYTTMKTPELGEGEKKNFTLQTNPYTSKIVPRHDFKACGGEWYSSTHS